MSKNKNKPTAAEIAVAAQNRLASLDVHEKAREDFYTVKLPYGEKNSPERIAYGAEELRLYDLFYAEILAEYGLDPNSETGRRVFNTAWGHGHSSGYVEVANIFSDFAEIAHTAITEYGKK